MLTKAEKIEGYKLNGIDGEVGSVEEFFFDDNYWTIRYLVANTGGWLSGRQVLISPYFLKNVNYQSELIDVNLTKSEIENSPPLESNKPVSRQFEESYYGYYGTPVYWGGPFMWGSYPYIMTDREKWDTESIQDKTWDPNLRSTQDVSSHNIQALDDEIGHVSDFIIDDENWAIRYLVVDTKKWWFGKKVLVAPSWIDRISWDESKVYVQLTRNTIKGAPEYDSKEPITRDYETRLHEYYEKQGYWTEDPVPREYHHR